VPEFADRFAGVTDAEIADLADSFRLDRCVHRTRLEDLLTRFVLTG